MILDNLDTVLAFTMIMLLLSLLATIIVQIVVSILGLRGRNLFWGVQRLFEQVAPKKTEALEENARRITREVLGHSVLAPRAGWIRKQVRGGSMLAGRWGPTALRTKDLLLVVDQIRGREGGDVKKALDEILPDQTEDTAAQAIRIAEVVKKLKETFPEQATQLEAVANETLEEVRGWTSRIEDWFEVVMDAAHERFKLWSRWITAGVAVSMALIFQIDSINILEQLGKEETRTRVLGHIEAVDALAISALAQTETDPLIKALESTREAVGKTELQIFHEPKWKLASKAEFEAYLGSSTFGGSVITALLLSLGAPFWYGLLKKLIGLKSIIATKQEQAAGAS